MLHAIIRHMLLQQRYMLHTRFRHAILIFHYAAAVCLPLRQPRFRRCFTGHAPLRLLFFFFRFSRADAYATPILMLAACHASATKR